MQGLSLLYQTNSSKSILKPGAMQSRGGLPSMTLGYQDTDIDAFYMKEN